MIITNKYNLPKTFMNIMNRPSYTRGAAHISATGLLSSPRIVQLTNKHDDEIVVDVTDQIWSIYGTAIHSVLEHGRDDNHIVEERLHADLDGWKISGAIDLQIIHQNGVEINDYKNVGVWSVMNEKIEWEQQLNIYAWLVETIKQTPVVKLAIVAIIRDWSRRDAKNKPNYPEAPVAVIDVKLWPMAERECFIRTRIHIHSEGKFATDANEELPLCTPAEMWEKPTTYAVKKEGAARAKSVHGDLEEAEEATLKAGKGYALEVREGERTRCANFCQVAPFCSQYKSYLEERNGN